MKDLASLLALPASLLLLVATNGATAQELEWPYNVPRTVKYFPEHEDLVRRNREAQEKLARHAPVGVKKMSSDEGEKFYPHYWDFGETVNLPTEASLQPPIAPHSDSDRPLGRLLRRAIMPRDYKCPADTNECSALKSNLCCPSDQTCVSTTKGVGCCPSGDTCGQDIGKCDTDSGYTECPNSLDGGCCVPGAECMKDGCVFYGTKTVTISGVVQTVTAGETYSTTSGPDGTTTYAMPAPSSEKGYTTTVTVTESVSGQKTTIVSTQVSTVVIGGTKGSSTCTSGYKTCASSLGGGCCKHDQVCGSSTSCMDASSDSSSSSATAYQPVQPTSVSDSSVSAATAKTTQSVDQNCPTGFYMCSAYYLGGCCRVGRNCDTTSCPSSESTTVISSGATVVVPVTSTTTVSSKSNGDISAAAAATSTPSSNNNENNDKGSCANGWFLCAADEDGGCCPSGHTCGKESCTAQYGQGSNTAKQAPSGGAGVVRWAWSFLALAATSAVGMIML